MINALLMFGSTYNKNKKINIILAISWIIFMLFGSNLKTGLIFTIMNFISYGFVFALSKFFKKKYSNTLLSVFSVLIWSITIDIICYFLYPQFTMGQNIFMYISNGILFNYKYVFYNMGVLSIGYLGKHIINLKRMALKKKTQLVNDF